MWHVLFAVGLVLCLTPDILFADDVTVQPEEGVVTIPTIAVTDQQPETPGTGTLHLQEQNPTSSRLGLSSRDIPASIEVVDQQTMQERGLRTISESIQGATGVTVGDSPGNPATFSMRGFTDNQIRLLYDGLVIGPATMTSRPRDTWNLDRIEILKGPASVLYGEGALAGAINFVTKRPVRGESGTETLLSYGSFNTVRAGVGQGGTLGNERLRYRVDVSYQNSDNFAGVQRAPYTYWNWTSGLLYDVTPRLSVEVSLDVGYDRSKPYWGTPLVPASFATQAVKGVVSTADGRTVDARMLRQNYNVENATMSSMTYWPKIKAQWKPADRIEIRNQTYYYTAERNWQNAETYTFNSSTQLIDRDRFFVEHDQSNIGDRLEFQANHPVLERKNRFVIGLDFLRQHLKRPSYFKGNVDSVEPFAPVAGLFGPITPSEQRTTITTAALFAEDEFSVTNELKIVGGIRQDHVDLDRKLFNAAGTLNTASSFSREFTPLTWRAGLVYDVLPTLTLYGQYSTAADPVGTNIFLVRSSENFNLATGRQWEVGVKGAFWDGKAEWTVAYFDIIRNNILSQTSLTDAQNVGRQSSHGVELSAAARPIPAWRIQGNMTVLSAAFDEFSETSGATVASRSGNTPPNVPRVVGDLWSIYRMDVRVPVDVGASYRYVGHRYANNANSVRMDEYSIVDAWIAIPYKTMWVTVRGRNLFDATYATWADTFYPDQVLIGAPRTLEVMLTARL